MWRLALVLVAGCNFVFGLDETVAVDGDFDFDSDGLQNTKDNCPTVANDLQDDLDGDQVGDACDPCPLGPESREDADKDGVDDACDPCTKGRNHDEDGDGFMDACDNCPAQTNDSQVNDDGDDLGNACDLDGGMQRRILFDGFENLASTWRSVDLWEAVNDAVVPSARDLNNHDLWDPSRGAVGFAWHAEVGFTVEAPGPSSSSSFVGLQVQTAQRSLIAVCYLHYSPGTGYDMYTTNGSGIVTPPPTGKVVLRMRSTPGTPFLRDIACELVGITSASGSTPSTETSGYVELHTQSTPFDYVDFIQD